MIYEIIEIPYRYDPYDPELNSSMMVWSSCRDGDVTPRITGERLTLRPLYKYKLLEIHGAMEVERVLVSTENLLTPGQNIWQQPHTLHTLLLRQRQGDTQRVFRHVPSVMSLRRQLGAGRIEQQTSNRFFLSQYLTNLGRSPNELELTQAMLWRIDDWVMEGAWPPEVVWQEMVDVEPNTFIAQLLSHVQTPIVFDSVTQQTNMYYPELRAEHMVPFLHPAFGSTGYRLTMTLDRGPLSKFDTHDAMQMDYCDPSAPAAFNQLIVGLLLLPLRDIVVEIDIAKQYYMVRYLRTNHDTIYTNCSLYQEWLLPTVMEWLRTSAFGGMTKITLVKSWTEEVFIVLETAGACKQFYVDLVIHGLCTHTLTTKA